MYGLEPPKFHDTTFSPLAHTESWHKGQKVALQKQLHPNKPLSLVGEQPSKSRILEFPTNANHD